MFRRFLYLKTVPTRAMQLRLQISKADCEASAEIAAPLGEDSKKLSFRNAHNIVPQNKSFKSS